MRETARINKAMHFSCGESTSAQFLGYSVFLSTIITFQSSLVYLAEDKSHDDNLGDKKTFKCPPKKSPRLPPFFPDLGKQRLRNGKKTTGKKTTGATTPFLPPSFFDLSVMIPTFSGPN